MDRRGVTGFPMRLVVTAVILSLCVPVLAEAADGFKERTCEKEAMSQIEIIGDVSSSLFFCGPGSARAADLQIPAGYEIWIGGEGAEAFSITLAYGDSPVRKVYMDHPALSFAGGCTRITGQVSLRLECVTGELGCEIEVTQI